jgi:hypothetical protein
VALGCSQQNESVGSTAMDIFAWPRSVEICRLIASLAVEETEKIALIELPSVRPNLNIRQGQVPENPQSLSSVHSLEGQDNFGQMKLVLDDVRQIIERIQSSGPTRTVNPKFWPKSS